MATGYTGGHALDELQRGPHRTVGSMTSQQSHPVPCSGRAGDSGAASHRGTYVIKRVTAIALATGAAAVALAGCGSSDDSSTDANGLRTPGTSTPASTTSAHPSSAEPTTAADAPSTTKAPASNSSLGPASSTSCGEFKKLDSTEEKELIEKVLMENPGSTFEGSPNVALGTAKLVCLAATYADTPVAVAAGIVAKDK